MIRPPFPGDEQLTFDLVETWRPRLHLDRWNINVDFDSERESAASCEALEEYCTGTVYFNLEQMDDAPIERYVVHELLHCHVNVLASVALTLAGNSKIKKEMVRRAEESLVTLLERLFIQAYSGAHEPTNATQAPGSLQDPR